MIKSTPWLIIGGTGQLGLTFQDYLKKQNIFYLAPKRNDLDLTNENQIFSYIDFAKPSIIVNCAAWTNVDLAENQESEALQINGIAVENLARAAKKSEARLVHISTDYVFSGRNKKPWREDDLTEPETAYGRTKHYGELVINKIYPENSLIFRTAWLYSRYGTNFVNTIYYKAINTNETLHIVIDQFGQPTLASDLVEQIALAIKSEVKPGIYHGTNSGQTSWYDLATEIFSLTGQDKSRIKPITSVELKRQANRPNYSVLGHDKWIELDLPIMREWKVALASYVNEILKQY